MGTRVEEEELLRREEAAAKAKASGAGNLWNTDLTTADGAMAVDEVVAAAARKRRAQLSGDSEEQRQAKMAHGFGNEPSKAERLQREEEAAADMQRVLGAKAARLKAQEAAMAAAEKEEAKRRTTRAAEAEADVARTLGGARPTGSQTVGTPRAPGLAQALGARFANARAAPASDAPAPPAAARAPSRPAVVSAKPAGAPIRQKVSLDGAAPIRQKVSLDGVARAPPSPSPGAGTGGAGGDQARKNAGAFAPAKYITNRYAASASLQKAEGKRLGPSVAEEKAAKAATGGGGLQAAVGDEDPVELAARRGKTLAELVAQEDEEEEEAAEEQVPSPPAAAVVREEEVAQEVAIEAPRAGGITLADALAAARREDAAEDAAERARAAPAPAPPPPLAPRFTAPSRVAAVVVAAGAESKGRWKVTNVKGLELRMEASADSAVVGKLAGFTFVTVETEHDGFLKVTSPLAGWAALAHPGQKGNQLLRMGKMLAGG